MEMIKRFKKDFVFCFLNVVYKYLYYIILLYIIYIIEYMFPQEMKGLLLFRDDAFSKFFYKIISIRNIGLYVVV